MHVDIDHVGRGIELQKDDRLASGEEQSAVSFLHGMQDRAVTKRPPGYEQILQTGAGHVILRPADQPTHGDLVVVRRHLDEAVCEARTEEPADPVPPRRDGGQFVNPSAIV